MSKYFLSLILRSNFFEHRRVRLWIFQQIETWKIKKSRAMARTTYAPGGTKHGRWLVENLSYVGKIQGFHRDEKINRRAQN